MASAVSPCMPSLGLICLGIHHVPREVELRPRFHVDFFFRKARFLAGHVQTAAIKAIAAHSSRTGHISKTEVEGSVCPRYEKEPAYAKQ